MSLSAFGLVVLAGFIHACWNIVAKQANGDARFALQCSLLTALLWAPLGLVLGWRLLPGWGVAEWAVVLASGALHVAYYIVLLRGYRAADLTVVYPLARGSAPLLSSLVALALFDEPLGWLNGAGIAGVVAGVFLVAGGPALWRHAPLPLHRARLHRGVRYGLLTGLFIAGYTVVDGYGVKALLMSPILLDYMGNAVRVVLLAPAALRAPGDTLRVWRLQWKHALLVAAMSPIAYVLVLYAVQQAPLSHVAPAREVSMLFAALIGGHLLREGDRLLRAAGAVLIAGGVILLAAA